MAAPTGVPQPEIHPLTPERWDDLVSLFRTGSETRWCWCMYVRRSARAFGTASAAANRTALRELAAGEPTAGDLAYRDGRAVGRLPRL